MYPRFLADSLLAALADTPVVLLVGARQTGKSTLVQDLIRDRHPARYLTLDDAVTLAAAHTDPVAFLQGEGNIVVDEVQRAPDLFLALKAAVDRNRAPDVFCSRARRTPSSSRSCRNILREGWRSSPSGPSLRARSTGQKKPS